MKAPWFWTNNRHPLLGLLLSPLGWLYGLGTKIRRACGTSLKMQRPIICVGNLVAGGSGKTPVVINLAKRLRNAHIVSRGYGGSFQGTLKVTPNVHTADQVGDEPLMMSGEFPTWVAKTRVDGCEASIAHGADCIILDDGFQDPSVQKDLSLIIVDGGFGFGNGHMIPAGPLRETIKAGLGRAQAVIIIGDDTTHIESTIAGHSPIIKAKLAPTIAANHPKRVLAFAGIGRPEKFFDSVRETGCAIAGAVSFADHHPYTTTEIKDLIDHAKSLGATPITTQKDWVRIPAQYQDQIDVLTVELIWEDASLIDALLKKHITV